MSNKLKGLRLLNTRPKKQGQQLSQMILQEGGVAVDCPALAIVPAEQDWLTQLPALDKINKAIFISSNAVEYFCEGLKKAKKLWPEHLQVIAIGKATASALKKLALTVSHMPEIADSEHILQLPIFQNISQQNILLVKGKNGRTLLEETLLHRGANLFNIEVYQRIMPSFDQNQLNSIWQNDAVDIILFTSEQAMQNLLAMFGQDAHHWLCHKPCLVISQRLAKAAAKLGMQQIIISHPNKIFDTLCDYNQGIIHGQ